MKPYFQVFALILLGYLITVLFVHFCVAPIQSFLFSANYFGGASLLFLPHGVRIMATWCFRFQAVIPLFWGEAIAWLIFGATNINLIFLSALVGSLSVLIVFEMFRLANVNLYYGGQIQFTWRLAIVVAFVSSCLNSVGHSFALSLSVSDYDIFLEISKFVIGDVLGTFVTFLFGMQIVRFVRLQKGF